VARRDGVSKLSAQQRARVENPEAYADHQNLNSELPTARQHMRRPVGQTTNSAPTYYEDLIAEQMRKGCTMEMAKVRVV
jgi:hypothetical protein